MSSHIFQEQTDLVVLSMPALIIILIILGMISLIMLWRKGKTAEAISLLNTFLIVIAIIFIVFLR
jgi:hypothetical protein